MTHLHLGEINNTFHSSCKETNFVSNPQMNIHFYICPISFIETKMFYSNFKLFYSFTKQINISNFKPIRDTLEKLTNDSLAGIIYFFKDKFVHMMSLAMTTSIMILATSIRCFARGLGPGS